MKEDDHLILNHCIFIVFYFIFGVSG